MVQRCNSATPEVLTVGVISNFAGGTFQGFRSERERERGGGGMQ